MTATSTAATTARKTKKTLTAAKRAAPSPAQTEGVAIAADVALAAQLPATARPVDPGITLNIVNLFRDATLVTSLQANAAAIDAQGKGSVEDILARIPSFVERYDALERLSVSAGRVRESLALDNADFSKFATAVATFFKGAGPLSPIKKDKALKKLAANRDIQRGALKMAKTKRKKARAKKAASGK